MCLFFVVTMEPKQTLLAEYRVYSRFVIPEGIDIHNQDQVHEWYIKYNRLTIVFKDTLNRPEITVLPYTCATNDDLKYPDDTTFEFEEVDEEYKDEDYVE